MMPVFLGGGYWTVAVFYRIDGALTLLSLMLYIVDNTLHIIVVAKFPPPLANTSKSRNEDPTTTGLLHWTRYAVGMLLSS